MLRKKKIFFVTNVDWFFISHRLPLALHALKEDYDVYILAADTGRMKELRDKGINCINIPFKRSGSNPFHELRCVYFLWKYYRKFNPDIIHHITLKASLLGSLAAKMSNNPHVINAISGLGYNFTNGRNGILQKIIKRLIRISFKSKHFSFILQNPDDVQMIKGLRLTTPDRVYLIKGSGVDLDEFNYSKLNNVCPLQILFPARILLDKGVNEFIEAAKIIQKDVIGQAVFILAGDCDKENLAVLKEEDLKRELIPGYIEWIGHQKKMRSIYINSDIVVLPSYREGLPKSLIEACAIGRPIVTTDVPGCRECVIPDYNGYLVPVKNAEKLAEAIKTLIRDANKRNEFGENSRKLAEKEFSIESVIQQTFSIYNSII